MSQTPAGWYPDADGVVRWWDGTQWTEFTRPQSGQQPQAGQQLQSWPAAQQGGSQQGWPAGPQGGSQQGWGQQGWPGGQPSYAMPPSQKKGLSPALWAGLGGGLLALVAVVVVLVLVLDNGGNDKKSPAAATATTASTTTPTPSDTGSPSDTSSPSPTGTGTNPGRAAGAPKNASVPEFCRSFDLTTFQSMNTGNLTDSLQKLQRLQTRMLAVGTPSDMPANARRGWEWFADLNPTDPSTALSMNQDDVSALGYYYGTKCY